MTIVQPLLTYGIQKTIIIELQLYHLHGLFFSLCDSIPLSPPSLSPLFLSLYLSIFMSTTLIFSASCCYPSLCVFLSVSLSSPFSFSIFLSLSSVYCLLISIPVSPSLLSVPQYLPLYFCLSMATCLSLLPFFL